jgi:diacylglycerol kinase family enzyme
MSGRRAGAIVALLAGALALATALILLVENFPRGALVFVFLALAAAVGWEGLLRRGVQRGLGLGLAALLLAAAIYVVVSGHHVLGWALVGICIGVSVGGARVAFRAEHSLPRADPPRRPVLFINPHSGEGRAEKVGLDAAARERGIEVVELQPGQDLAALVREAVGRGADALAMAGGDGSQAVVATIAAEHDLPYACIPAGTRNHFALDLGVDREDVVGALDAFVDGGERPVDLGEVNGRVFVNNVSLGVYAEAVSQDAYRQAKLRTLLDTLSGTLGPEGDTRELRWRDPDGTEQRSTALVLVSNNPYLLGPTNGSGTRPRLDAGTLGIVDFSPPIGTEKAKARWRELTATELTVESDEPVPLGIDGEAATLEPPLRFRVRPQALRVRIARDHPGASPSATVPRSPLSVGQELGRLAFGGSR